MLYFKVAFYLIKSQLEHRASVMLITFGQALIIFITVFAMSLLFEKFDNIVGWKKFDVLFCCSIVNICFSFSECIGKSFQNFKQLLMVGKFDRLVLRPRSTFIQVLSNEFDITKIGRLLQSVLFLVYAMQNSNVSWNLTKVIFLFLSNFLGILIFLGVFILSAAVNFFSIQQTDIASLFINGGRELGQYPISIYSKITRIFFTYIIPIGCVTYFPVCFILEKKDPFFGDITVYMVLLSYMVCLLFFISSILVWNISQKNYESCGG